MTSDIDSLGFVKRPNRKTSRFVGVGWASWHGRWAAGIYLAGSGDCGCRSSATAKWCESSVKAPLARHESPIFIAFPTPETKVAKVAVEGSNPFSRSNILRSEVFSIVS
jgi:hypothetical protein